MWRKIIVICVAATITSSNFVWAGHGPNDTSNQNENWNVNSVNFQPAQGVPGTFDTTQNRLVDKGRAGFFYYAPSGFAEQQPYTKKQLTKMFPQPEVDDVISQLGIKPNDVMDLAVSDESHQEIKWLEKAPEASTYRTLGYVSFDARKMYLHEERAILALATLNWDKAWNGSQFFVEIRMPIDFLAKTLSFGSAGGVGWASKIGDITAVISAALGFSKGTTYNTSTFPMEVRMVFIEPVEKPIVAQRPIVAEVRTEPPRAAEPIREEKRQEPPRVEPIAKPAEPLRVEPLRPEPHKLEIRSEPAPVKTKKLLVSPIFNCNKFDPFDNRTGCKGAPSVDVTETNRKAIDAIAADIDAGIKDGTLVKDGRIVRYVDLKGYCDYRGPEGYNLELGMQRGRKIAAAVIIKLVDTYRNAEDLMRRLVRPSTVGKEKPYFYEDDASNRRVDYAHETKQSAPPAHLN